MPYDDAYFSRFAAQAETDIGRALMQARVDFVARRWKGVLVDVGIGSGAFVELRNKLLGFTPERPATFGYDVCPQAVEWLGDRFWNPYEAGPDAISLWDVLEHIPDFPVLLKNVTAWVFVSIPIYRNVDHCLQSKHFKDRKTEHCWHFTRNGLVKIMEMCGFVLVDENDMETRIGREDIGTFSFLRRRI